MRRIATTILLAGLWCTVPHTASAGPVTINIGNFSGGTAVLHAPGTIANNLNVHLGAVRITGDLGTFESYCVDLQHYAILGTNQQAVVDSMSNWNNSTAAPISSLGGNAAAWLYNSYRDTAAGNQQKQAALSMAIWNVLYDNDFSVLTAGSIAGRGFWVSSVANLGGATNSANAVNQANQWLGALQLQMSQGKPLGTASWLRTVNNTNGTSQDFIASQVPEPASILLMIGGLVGLFAFRRRPQYQTARY
jgi:hypothetical protein